MAEKSKGQIWKAVEARLVARQEANFANPKAKKARDDEAAFLAGAAAALQAVYGKEGSNELTEYVRPLWMLYPLSGRSVIESIKKGEGA